MVEFLTSPLGMGAVAAVVVLLLLFMLRGKKGPRGLGRDLTLDVRTLAQKGPPPGPPKLLYRSVPVRLAAVILAPVGKADALNTGGGFPNMLEQIVPGLGKIMNLHQPVVRMWPAQVSRQGFAPSFWRNVPVPGLGGKKTPWCSLAGVANIEGKPVCVGVMLCADGPVDLGQGTAEFHGWQEMLKVAG